MENFKTIIFKLEDRELELNIYEEEQTAWMTQQQISMLYDKSIPSISRIIKSGIKDYEKKVPPYLQILQKRSLKI